MRVIVRDQKEYIWEKIKIKDLKPRVTCNETRPREYFFNYSKGLM